MAALSFADNQTPSSIYAGFASGDYANDFKQSFKDIVTSAKDLTDKLIGTVDDAVAQIKKGWNFFTSWWKDDPVGATSGVIAAGLSLGLVVVVAGSASGVITGGIAALKAMRIVTLIKAGIKIAAAFISVGALIRFMIQGVQYLWNFNWNMTDNEIASQQQQALVNLYTAAGSVIGTSLATLLCGVAPIEISKRTGIIKVNPATLAMLRDLTEFSPQSDEYGEIYEEMMESMKALITAGKNATARILFLESYKNIRKWIKDSAKGKNLSSIYPGLDEIIKKWGNEGSQPWSFASATEGAIDSISDEKIKALTEETVESFMDTCTENAMVVSYLF